MYCWAWGAECNKRSQVQNKVSPFSSPLLFVSLPLSSRLQCLKKWMSTCFLIWTWHVSLRNYLTYSKHTNHVSSVKMIVLSTLNYSDILWFHIKICLLSYVCSEVLVCGIGDASSTTNRNKQSNLSDWMETPPCISSMSSEQKEAILLNGLWKNMESISYILA